MPKPENFRVDNRVSDITDGMAYRELHQNCRQRLQVADGKLLITLILNTDGLQLHDSGHRSVWPVFAAIAELPARRRYMNDKIVTVALWEGQGKPPLRAIMRQLQVEIMEINQQGGFQ